MGTKEEARPDVSVIIVNYNTKDLLVDCLDSIKKQTKGVKHEVIISDNASSDGSMEAALKVFPKAIALQNGQNLGFGRANNRALDIAKGKYVFYLNSDTILKNNAIKIFFDYFEANDTGTLGAIGANLTNERGQTIHSCGAFLSYKAELCQLARAFLAVSYYTVRAAFGKKIPDDIPNYLAVQTIGPVDYVTGADLFMKNDQNARFDEDFFMYCEDADIQCRLAQKGLERRLIDGPQIVHLQGASGGKKLFDKVRSLTSFSSLCFNVSRIIYFRKRGRSGLQLFLLKALTLLIWLNPLIFGKAKGRIKELLSA